MWPSPDLLSPPLRTRRRRVLARRRFASLAGGRAGTGAAAITSRMSSRCCGGRSGRAGVGRRSGGAGAWQLRGGLCGGIRRGGEGGGGRGQTPCGGCTSGERSACGGVRGAEGWRGRIKDGRRGPRRGRERRDAGRTGEEGVDGGERTRLFAALSVFCSVELRLQRHVWSRLLPSRTRQWSPRRKRRIRQSRTLADT